ncbi:glutamate-rich protein 6 [Platysternon megacephalum]|uniref:Glutamate-rich protein 6 n=1 Tax=Platysternon megacephalum TaxID=55544 RepID=A0A4D9EFF5_9SAUR|nr:glutamate-rich protein 6 [Platysternon megacephalum]
MTGKIILNGVSHDSHLLLGKCVQLPPEKEPKMWFLINNLVPSKEEYKRSVYIAGPAQPTSVDISNFSPLLPHISRQSPSPKNPSHNPRITSCLLHLTFKGLSLWLKSVGCDFFWRQINFNLATRTIKL